MMNTISFVTDEKSGRLAKILLQDGANLAEKLSIAAVRWEATPKNHHTPTLTLTIELLGNQRFEYMEMRLCEGMSPDAFIAEVDRIAAELSRLDGRPRNGAEAMVGEA